MTHRIADTLYDLATLAGLLAFVWLAAGLR